MSLGLESPSIRDVLFERNAVSKETLTRPTRCKKFTCSENIIIPPSFDTRTVIQFVLTTRRVYARYRVPRVEQHAQCALRTGVYCVVCRGFIGFSSNCREISYYAKNTRRVRSKTIGPAGGGRGLGGGLRSARTTLRRSHRYTYTRTRDIMPINHNFQPCVAFGTAGGRPVCLYI